MRFLPRFSFGVGDRFAHQAAAQLEAFERLAAAGVVVAPVWSTSNREHAFIGSETQSVREVAAKAVAARQWPHPWFVDADRIRRDTVDPFLAMSDYFTIDVANSIGKPADPADVTAFVARHPELGKPLAVPGITKVIRLSEDGLAAIVRKYLPACREAGEIDRHIRAARGDDVVIEVSMAEADEPQRPPQLLVILAMLAEERIPLQTIAPRFTGRFNKGVDDVGDLMRFEQEFSDDIAVCGFAAKRYGLPESLKLSVHSGSDTFSLYPVIRRTVARTGVGVHLKPAGTTWLEANRAIVATQVTDNLFDHHLRPLFLTEGRPWPVAWPAVGEDHGA
ncbi:MAG: tagaturonate epimerase family protein [Planctomycetia bacterium]